MAHETNRLLAIGFSLGVIGLVAFAPVSAAGEAAAGGKKVFLDSKCNGCHSVKSEGIAHDEKMAGDAEEEKDEAAEGKRPKPPDLSDAGKLHDAAFIDSWLRKKESIEGRKHPRRFNGSPEDRATLTTWLCSLKAEPEKTKTK